MKKELILFYYSDKKFSIQQREIKRFKKNYSKVILYNNFYEYKPLNYNYNNKILKKLSMTMKN